MTVWEAITGSFRMMLETGNQAIRIVGPGVGNAQFIEIVTDELPLRQSMYRFSRNVVVVALIIAVLTAGLVYLALHYLFVRPMRRLTASLVGFHENPESSARIIVPSQRSDEIGVAERELSDMQRDLMSMLHQKSRLAALGLAVSKINHDLRNLLASAQLLSDQLASVPDPRVQRFAPKLVRSLERAIAFCQSTLSYGRAQEAAPDRRMMLIEPVVAEVRETAGLASDVSIAWVAAIERGLAVDADPDQLFRVLLNLVRNAAQALESHPSGDGGRAADPDHGQARGRGRDPGGLRHRPRRAPEDPRPSVRGVPDLRPPRRQRARACHRRRAGPRPWRRHPSGRRHHRRHLPDRHPRPPRGTPIHPQRAGSGRSRPATAPRETVILLQNLPLPDLANRGKSG